MSKLLLTLLSIIQFSTSWAQIDKGTTILNGSLTYSKIAHEPPVIPENDLSGFGVSLSAGRALNKNFVMGIQGGRYLSTTSDDVQRFDSYEIGVFARQYFQIAKKLYIFGQGTLKYGQSKREGGYNVNNTIYSFTEKMNTVSLGLSPAISYALTPRIQLEGIVPYLFSIAAQSRSYHATYPLGESREKSKSISGSGGTDSGNLNGVSLGISVFINKR